MEILTKHDARLKCRWILSYFVLLFVIHQTISDTQPSVLLPYLNINGPVHQKSLVNETISLRCHVTVLMSNHSAVVFTPKLNFQNQSSTKWYASTPESLNPTVKLSVQWIKDGFGYDADALLHTFGGRYRMLGSSTKGDFTLTISELTFEDEGEYACQASLVLQSPKLWSSSRTGQDLQKRIPDKDSVRGLTITMLPMSLIKSETASVKIVVPPRQLELYQMVEVTYPNRTLEPRPVKNGHNEPLWIHVGETFHMQCHSDGSRPVAHLKWLINNCPIDEWASKRQSSDQDKQWTENKIECHEKTAELIELAMLAKISTDKKPKQFTWKPWQSSKRRSQRGDILASVPGNFVWKAVTDIKILPLEVPMDSFTIRCEVNNDWDFSTKEENVAMVNGNPVRPYQRKYLGNKTKLSISTTISFHFLSHLIIVTGPPTQPKESVFIENHPVRFECQVGRFQPKTALLTYEWSIVDSASEIVPADKLLNIMANKTVHLISSNQHSSRIEILVNREMHKKILRCTVHSQLKRPVNLNESGPPVVTSSASLELKILYGPRIKRQETTYVPIRLPNPEEYTGSDHLVFPDDESGFWNSTTLAWLECETDSNPPAHISWYFRLPNGSMQLTGFETRQPVKLYQNGNLLPALSKDYVSTVSTTLGTKDTSDEVEQRSSQEEHILRGLWNFTCEAYSSGFPRQRASRVVGLADVPMLTGRNQVFVRIGQAVELQCDIRSLPAPFESSIQWNFHAILFKEDPRSLHLFTLSSAAVERYGTSDANILEVHQLLVNRQWMITNEEVVLGWISRLRIQHVTEKHFGLYNCSARNELGGGWHITLLRQAQGDGRGFLRMEYMVHLLTGILFVAVFGCLCYLIWFRKLICHGWVSPLAWKLTCMRSQSNMRNPASVKIGPSGMMENAPRFFNGTYPRHSYVETFHVIANQLNSPGLCECGSDLLYTKQQGECSAVPPMEFQIIRGGSTLPTKKPNDERHKLQQIYQESTEEKLTQRTFNSFPYTDLLKNRPLIDRQEDNFQPSNNSDFSRSQAISQRPQRLSMAHQMLSFNNRSSDTTLASSYDLQHWTRFHASATRNTQKPRRIKYGEECKRAAGRISSLENQPCNIPQLLPSAVKEK